MTEQTDKLKPHGDPIADAANNDDNRAQRDRNAPPDATVAPGDDRMNNSDRAGGRGSDANGVPAFDEAEGEERKKLYRDGATLVSRID